MPIFGGTCPVACRQSPIAAACDGPVAALSSPHFSRAATGPSWAAGGQRAPVGACACDCKSVFTSLCADIGLQNRPLLQKLCYDYSVEKKFDRRRVGQGCCTYIPYPIFTKLELDVLWTNPKLCTKFHASMTTRSLKMSLGGNRAMAATWLATTPRGVIMHH